MKTDIIKIAHGFQSDEITDHNLYLLLSKHAASNRKVLKNISDQEMEHYNFWKKMTGKDAEPNHLKIWLFRILANTLGITFALRLMESGEEDAQAKYSGVKGIKGISRIISQERCHENKLISLLKDERLDYTGSVVLGLNDALVELTGALAGMTFALRNAKLVAIAGLITGLAASLSMAASNYLETKEDASTTKKPLKSAIYTGVTYLFVVAILISPYFLLNNIYWSLATTLTLAVVLVGFYTFYITTAKMKKFWPQFLEMAGISLATAVISFLFGMALNHWIGV
jgi:vacuolar iron transporter family protein